MIQIAEERPHPYYQLTTPEPKCCPDSCLGKISCVLKSIFCCACSTKPEEPHELLNLSPEQTLYRMIRHSLPPEISELKIDEIASHVLPYVETYNLQLSQLTVSYQRDYLQIIHTQTHTTLYSKRLYFPKESALYITLRNRFTTKIPDKKITEITTQLIKQIQPRHLQINELILTINQNYLIVSHPEYQRDLIINQLYPRQSPVLRYSCLPHEVTLTPLPEETESPTDKSD